MRTLNPSSPSRTRHPRSFGKGGIHPDGCKGLAAHVPIRVLPPPPLLQVPLLQHTGAPCEPRVKPRETVEAYARIADAEALISAPVHTPVAGVVQREGVATLPNGRHVRTIPIKAAPDTPDVDAIRADILGGNWPTGDLAGYEPEALIQTIRDAGIVGQGGAAFPTHVKLRRNPEKPVDTVLVNGCECEPYLTSDYRFMIEAAASVVAGARIAARACGAETIHIAIENDRAEAIQAMREAAGDDVRVAIVQTQYPMGGEKQTVRAVLGRTIPTGGLPLDVGVVVLNVTTASAIARAVLRGKPLTHRVVCVTGAGIREPANLLTPVGVPIRALIEACGGLTSDAGRLIAGGPMMGFAVGDLDTPITKGTGGLVVLTKADIQRSQETACVRCGRCVEACPLGLVPSRIALAARHKDWDLARRYHMAACMECGCCAYVCPASIPLVQLMRMGKTQMLKETRA